MSGACLFHRLADNDTISILHTNTYAQFEGHCYNSTLSDIACTIDLTSSGRKAETGKSMDLKDIQPVGSRDKGMYTGMNICA